VNRPGDVLIVDDDPDLIEVMRSMIAASGYEARCARNGKEAIERVEEKRPAVLLLDMLMPVMDGWQCARELRARYGHDLPIVVVTAAEHARARANETNGDDVLPKPFEMDDLLRVVARFVQRTPDVPHSPPEPRRPPDDSRRPRKEWHRRRFTPSCPIDAGHLEQMKPAAIALQPLQFFEPVDDNTDFRARRFVIRGLTRCDRADDVAVRHHVMVPRSRVALPLLEVD